MIGKAVQVLVALGAMLACAVPAAEAQAQKPLRKVIFVTNHQQAALASDVYLFAVPNALGFFREEGLEVEYLLSPGSAAAVQLVVGGKADIGNSNPGPIFNAIQKGAPLRGFYNLSPQYTSGLAVLDSSPITSPKQLKPGMLIGVASLASGHVPTVRAMLRSIGLKPDEDVKIVAVGTGAQAATALQSGQVQAIFLWDLAYNAIIARGVNLRIMREVLPNAEKILDGVQFASKEFIAKNPDIIVGMGRAQAKGIVWSAANPEAALEIFYKTYPQASARSDEQRQNDLKLLKLNIDVDNYRKKGMPQFGRFTQESVAVSTEFLVNAGELQPVPDLNVFYTNEFVDAANAFDIKKVEATPKPAE